MGDLTKDFSIAEVRCKCPDCIKLDSPIVPTMEVMLGIQGIRDDVGVPLTPSCGVRCEKNNESYNGAPDSRHLPKYRDAIDLECTDSTLRYKIVASAIRRNFRFIEVCPNHIHLDMRPSAFKLICGSDH